MLEFAEGPGYRRLTTSPGLEPSPGPGGGSGTGTGGPSAALQAILDQMLAEGAAQADADAILALIPQVDATGGPTVEIGDVDDPWPPEESVELDPKLEEPV